MGRRSSPCRRAIATADYDFGGRIDNGYDVSVSWSRRLTNRLVVGLAADFSGNASNVEGAGYQVFEIGPRLTVDLVGRKRTESC